MKNLNKRIIQIMSLLRDNFGKKREVTHWFYFNRLSDLEKCESHLNSLGLKTQFKDFKIRKNFDRLLLIVSTYEAIDEEAFNLNYERFSEVAEIYNGEYDGWETKIENSEQLN